MPAPILSIAFCLANDNGGVNLIALSFSVAKGTVTITCEMRRFEV